MIFLFACSLLLNENEAGKPHLRSKELDRHVSVNVEDELREMDLARDKEATREAFLLEKRFVSQIVCVCIHIS